MWIGSKADSHFEVSSGNLDPSVTLAVGVGVTVDWTSGETNDLDGVVVPEDQSELSTLMIDYIEDDVTVSVDATISLAVGRSQALTTVVVTNQQVPA